MKNKFGRFGNTTIVHTYIYNRKIGISETKVYKWIRYLSEESYESSIFSWRNIVYALDVSAMSVLTWTFPQRLVIYNALWVPAIFSLKFERTIILYHSKNDVLTESKSKA